MADQEKCFCHFNGYQVKDAAARKKLEKCAVLQKGNGVDSIEQVITTESGNPERDNKPVASGEAAAAFGKFTEASGKRAFVVNYDNKGAGNNTFTAGAENSTEGNNSATMGQKNKTPGIASFTAGNENTTSCYYGATVGSRNTNTGDATFVGGNQNANEGGQNGFLVGMKNIMQGHYSFLGGIGSLLSGHASFGYGQYLKVTGNGQSVFGAYNAPNNNAVLILGNGKSDTERSNAFEIDKYGSIAASATYTIESKESLQNLLISIAKQMSPGAYRKIYLKDSTPTVFYNGYALATLHCVKSVVSGVDTNVCVDICTGSNFHMVVTKSSDGTWSCSDIVKVMTADDVEKNYYNKDQVDSKIAGAGGMVVHHNSGQISEKSVSSADKTANVHCITIAKALSDKDVQHTITIDPAALGNYGSSFPRLADYVSTPFEGVYIKAVEKQYAYEFTVTSDNGSDDAYVSIVRYRSFV